MENTYYDLILEAEMGDTEAQLVLSLLYEQDGNYTEAAKWCEMAARQGDPDAQNRMGIYYASGQGVEQDDAKSFYWYSEAADRKNSAAQCNLGYCWLNGIGVEASPENAFYWYEQAALLGDSQAQIQLG